MTSNGTGRPPRTSAESLGTAVFLRCHRSERRSSSTEKALKARLARPDKFQESDSLEIARFTDAQQDQILSYARLRARSTNDVPKKGKFLDRMFSVIVVPGNAVMVQKRKERISVLLETLTPRLYDIGFPIGLANDLKNFATGSLCFLK
jgi:hypothetical protein